MNKLILRKTNQAFTIVELLVVIVVIGILAVITIISYGSITQRARAASIVSDLQNSSKQLKMYQVSNDSYPTSLDCSATPVANSICLKSSNSGVYTYQPGDPTSPQSFRIYESISTATYRVSNDTSPVASSLICPSGFIIVPGSVTYGTSDFCVMKYEAKQSSATVPISKAAGVPWYSITKPNAATYSANVAGCAGCHLMTMAEVLTITQNLMNVASNWSGGSIGSGAIYKGHSDQLAVQHCLSLASDANDLNGYYGECDSPGSAQRRTLTLSNGEVIWDFAGNLAEWLSDNYSGSQPGVSGELSYAQKEWNVVNINYINGSSINLLPSFGTPAASGWTHTQGLGTLFSNVSDLTAGMQIDHGGSWADGGWYGGYSGVYAFEIGYASSYICNTHGFRVAK